jgi:signal transduction histidine kinase
MQSEQSLLELVKKQQELNDLKSAFVNMVSHELRTPLTVISSSAEILELLFKSGKTAEELSVYTQQIILEVDKMTAFMQDLLMVSKIEAGKLELNISTVNIIDTINDIAKEAFMPWKDGRTITVSHKRQPQLLQADNIMLKHAIQNLLHNSFKYSSGKSAPRLNISFGKTFCNISIIDEGIGITAEDIVQLFTSFKRGKNTSNIPGTGIGLVVVKYFIEQHKGFVHVKSKPNVGSIFTIHLPYQNY